MREWKSDIINILEKRESAESDIPSSFRVKAAAGPIHFHRQLSSYEKTPLVSLPNLAASWGVKGIYIKDESKRFSLHAFKGLGGSYAMFRILCERLGLDPEQTGMEELTGERYRDKLSRMEFVTCTDGNHGRGVSWAAGLFGCKAHIFMPYGTMEVRAEAIRSVGPAEVTITDMSYDDTVKYALEMSKKKDWILIQDTSWDGYEQIPSWIIQGYLTMASEINEELDRLQIRPSHIFLQAGVGAMAGGMLAFFADRYGKDKPTAVIVEPKAADCVYRSAKAGCICPVEGAPVTIMAGLNCGTPCSIIWPLLRDYAEFFLAGSDEMAADGMRAYAAGMKGDPKIISGESGAATLGAAHRLLCEPSLAEAKKAMELDETSILLLINTEGDTDPENYRRIVHQ